MHDHEGTSRSAHQWSLHVTYQRRSSRLERSAVRSTAPIEADPRGPAALSVVFTKSRNPKPGPTMTASNGVWRAPTATFAQAATANKELKPILAVGQKEWVRYYRNIASGGGGSIISCETLQEQVCQKIKTSYMRKTRRYVGRIQAFRV